MKSGVNIMRRGTVLVWGVLLCVGLLSSGCSEDDTNSVAAPNNTGVADMGNDSEGVEDMGDDVTSDVMDDAEEDVMEPVGDCNPLAPEHDCLLPYPSNFFLEENPALPSGKQVVLTEDAKLTNALSDAKVDFTRDNPVDGFSMNMPLMAYFGREVDTTNVNFHTDDPASSMLPGHPTVLFEAESGEPVPHWAEVDKFEDVTSEQRVFIIRPLVRLKPETRYVVGLHSLLDLEGAPIEAPKGFATLRDQAPVEPESGLTKLASRYEEDVFAPLESFGVERARLQLAWDFTTGSQDHLTRDMLKMREEAAARFAQTPPTVTVQQILPDHNEHIALRVEGTIRVPLFLTSDQPDGLLQRGEDGLPMTTGDVEVPFTMQVPVSAMPVEGEPFEAAPIIVYGHGFFGVREEINYGSFLRRVSNEQRYVTIAVDWWGMSELDIDTILLRLANDTSSAFNFVQRLPQAIINFLALQEAVQTTLREVPELSLEGQLLYNPDKMVYYGISQGHIFGVPLLTMSSRMDRAVLGVGGGSYALMMTRANAFKDLFIAVNLFIREPRDIQKMLMLSQHVWDRMEPMTFAQYLIRNPFPWQPEDRRHLMHNGVGDHSVNNLASDLLAREVGAPVLEPTPVDIYGVDTVEGPVEGDAQVMFDFNLEVTPGLENRLPAEEELNNVHEGVRQLDAVHRQIKTFYETGVIEHTCEGPCNPE